MLRKISNLNIKDDPIRPELELWWRLIKGREVYGFFEKEKCKAVVCIAKMIDVPKNTHELRDSVGAGRVMVAYTLWSYEKGYGTKLIQKLKKEAQNQYMQKLVTLSPLTKMARNFHLKNGAKIFRKNHNTINFEYKL
jgi:predicted GNAT family N-acyltransferase